jgi:hypothetical protein
VIRNRLNLSFYRLPRAIAAKMHFFGLEYGEKWRIWRKQVRRPYFNPSEWPYFNTEFWSVKVSFPARQTCHPRGLGKTPYFNPRNVPGKGRVSIRIPETVSWVTDHPLPYRNSSFQYLNPILSVPQSEQSRTSIGCRPYLDPTTIYVTC